MHDAFHIVYILNDAYWVPVLVSAFSVLKNTHHANLIFHFCVDGVTEEHQQLIASRLNSERSMSIFHNIDMHIFKDLPAWHGTKLVWARCLLYELLPDVHGWVCICDGDTLWYKGVEDLISELELLPSSVIIAGSHNNDINARGPIVRLNEVGINLLAEDTFCLGFAVVHIDRMRAFNTYQKCISYLDRYGITKYLEQDIFNWIFRNNKYILSYGWGAYSSNGNLRWMKKDALCVVHYVCDLPWIQSWRNGLTPVKRDWWHMAEQCGAIKYDPRYSKNRITFIIMQLISFSHGMLPACLRKRIQGDFT